MTIAPPESSGNTFPDRPDQTSDSPPENSRRFVLLDLSVLEDYDLSSQALALYAHLKKFADYETGRCWPRKETLAARLRMAQGRSVDRYITELRECGLIQDVRPRFRNPDDNRDWVLDEPDEVHTTQTSNLYVVNMEPASPQVRPECAPTQGGGAAQRSGGVRQNADEQEPSTNNQRPTTNLNTSEELTSEELTSAEKTSVGGAAPIEFSEKLVERKHRNGEGTPKAMPLHPRWQPNNANRAVARKIGVDLTFAVEQFRDAMRGEKRRCWGSAFTKFLKAMAEQKTVQFGVSTDELINASVTRSLEAARTRAQKPAEAKPDCETSGTPNTRNGSVKAAEVCMTTHRSTDIEGPFKLRAAIWTLEDDGYRGASVRDRVRELFEGGVPTFDIIKLVKREFAPELENLTA